MSASRFILVLAVHSNLVQVSLVLANGRIAASARQAYQTSDSPSGLQTFDPIEIWYKTKQATTACLDIARTQPREIAALALVHSNTEFIVWIEHAGETIAQGIVRERDSEMPDRIQTAIRAFVQTAKAQETTDPIFRVGGMDTWLMWNLTGEFVTSNGSSGWKIELPNEKVRIETPRQSESDEVNCFGKTRVRGPFAAEFPVVAVVNENVHRAEGGGVGEENAAVIAAARAAFRTLGLSTV